MSGRVKRYTIETIIRDAETHKPVFHFKPMPNNLVTGALVTEEFITLGLGIDIRPKAGPEQAGRDAVKALLGKKHL